jgi:tetratricopeptide (TPR) repeat protein
MPSNLMQPRILDVLRTALFGTALVVGIAQAAAAQTPSSGDLTALRYYWEQQDETSVRSETRRLMLEFPDWTPPSDLGQLFLQTEPERITEVYRLIEMGEFDAARSLIAEIDRQSLDWTPPAEMMEYLTLAHAQVEFEDAERRGDEATLVNIARGVPALLSCERVNNAWLLAEAHTALGDPQRAIAVLSAVIATCHAPEILIATLEKAADIATIDTLAELSDAAQRQAPEATTSIRAAEDRLRLGLGAEPRAGQREQRIALSGAASVPASARPTPRPDDTTRRATTSTPATSSASAAAPVTPGGGGGGTLSAVRAAASRGAWAQCLSLSQGTRNADVLLQRGWCAYNADRAMEAVSTFEQVAREARNADIRRDASYGLLLSMLQLNMTEQAAQIAASAPLTRTQRIEIEGQILDQRGVRAYEAEDYRRAAAFFAAHAELTGSTRRDLGLLHGYALLNSGDRQGAEEIFSRLHRQMATPETERAMRSLR